MRPAYKIGLLIICFFAFVFPTGAGAALYALDDGHAEWGIGPAMGVSMFTWGNNFNRMPGSEVITAISASFGFSTGVNLDGLGITGSIWSDPNSDGNPGDAVQLASVSGFIANYGVNGHFNTYDIDDTLVTPSFFVVFSFVSPDPSDPNFMGFPAQYDENNDGPLNIAWVAVDEPFTDAVQAGSPVIGGSGYSYTGAFLIRAEGAPSPNPPRCFYWGAVCWDWSVTAGSG